MFFYRQAQLKKSKQIIEIQIDELERTLEEKMTFNILVIFYRTQMFHLEVKITLPMFLLYTQVYDETVLESRIFNFHFHDIP